MAFLPSAARSGNKTSIATEFFSFCQALECGQASNIDKIPASNVDRRKCAKVPARIIRLVELPGHDSAPLPAHDVTPNLGTYFELE